ncbi:MAG: GNAT family N-acetyltransferase [Saprospiraceae bacterium]|nr:GNAT family N-acetyltransferase [Saprospiraceae bacterium]
MPLITAPIPADLPVLAALARKALWESHGHSCAHEDMAAYIAHRLSDEALLAELLDERNTFRWIHHEGHAAGYSKIILNCPHEFVAAQNVTKMERLYLLESFHGLGLAQQLFDHNLDIAKQAKQAGIWLYVWKENHRAVAFYQKMGFEIVGEGLFKISETHYNPNHVMFLGMDDAR